MQDFFDGCYAGEHKKLSVTEFKSTFCNQCLNTQCKNSKGSGLSWIQRMSTQEDRLLNNPLFADPNDPRFQQWANMNFQDKLQEVLALDVSSRKGDWSVPTREEISQEALQLISPTSFQPAPPEKLVDEVNVTGLDGKKVESKAKNTWKVLGDKGITYVVSLMPDNTYACTCPAQQFYKERGPCKHIQNITQRLQKPAPPAPVVPEPPRMPPANVAPIFRPPSEGNTKTPQEGILIGPPEKDPWSVPAQDIPLRGERVVPVGGKVRFGGK